MILTCPSCETRYNLDAARLHPGGRVVRCVKCGHVWKERSPGVAPEIAAPRLSDPGFGASESISGLKSDKTTVNRVTSGSPTPAKPRGSIGQLAGWVLLAAFVTFVVGGGLFMRHSIVALWPPATVIFQMVGLSVLTAGEGLELRNVTSAHHLENNRPILIIKGEIANISDVVRGVPTIRASLLDVGQREIYSWMFSASQKELSPGQTVSFDTRVTEPPESAHGLEVTFYIDDNSG